MAVSYNGSPMLVARSMALFLVLALQSDGDGHAALREGRYREALEIFDALIASQPESASAHHGKGRALSALGNDRAAIAHFDKAVALAPTWVSARYDYARTLEALVETELAIDAYRSVLELDPYHRGARYRLGTLLLREGRAEQAGRFLRGYEPFRLWDHQVRLLDGMVDSGKLTPEDRKRKTLALVRLLLDGGDIDEARRILVGALADYPDETSFDVAHARWLMLSGRAAEARDVLDPAMSNASTNRDAVWLSAQLHVHEHESVEALADLRCGLFLMS